MNTLAPYAPFITPFPEARIAYERILYNALPTQNGHAGEFLSTNGRSLLWSSVPPPAGAALTRVDDTNITLVLGGTPATALLQAVSLTLGWTGSLAINRGGTGQTTQAAAFDALAPTTTQGDIIIRGAANNERLAIGASGTVLGSDGTTPQWVANTGYVLSGSNGTFNPLDALTYFFGSLPSIGPQTTGGLRRVYVPKGGTITACYIFINNTVPSTAENATASIRLNNTTDTTVSSTVQFDASVDVFSNTGLSIAVAQGDYIELKILMPTWPGLNPTGVFVNFWVYIE